MIPKQVGGVYETGMNPLQGNAQLEDGRENRLVGQGSYFDRRNGYLIDWGVMWLIGVEFSLVARILIVSNMIFLDFIFFSLD